MKKIRIIVLTLLIYFGVNHSAMAIEQEKLGKRGQQEMAKLKTAAFIEWK